MKNHYGLIEAKELFIFVVALKYLLSSDVRLASDFMHVHNLKDHILLLLYFSNMTHPTFAV